MLAQQGILLSYVFRFNIKYNIPPMNKGKIIRYYDYTLPFYKIFYHGKTNAVHYGYWDSSVKTHNEALLNTNKFLARKLNLGANDYVLDAGCGIGGSSIWIAKNYNAHVIGITISPEQEKKAVKLAKENGVNDLVEFYERDYLNSGFSEDTFSVIWAIESICYAENKKDFLLEAYRIMKKGGRLIIWDGFLDRLPKDKEEEKDLKNFLEGWALINLANPVQFHRDLAEANFRNIQEFDVTREALPSAEKIYKMSRWSYPLSIIFYKVGLMPELSKITYLELFNTN